MSKVIQLMVVYSTIIFKTTVPLIIFMWPVCMRNSREGCILFLKVNETRPRKVKPRYMINLPIQRDIYNL